MNPIPEMIRQHRLDRSVIDMFEQGATGVWETFTGELYVSKEKENANDTHLQLGQESHPDTN